MHVSISSFLDDRHRPWARLFLTVLLSALLHGALIFAVRLGQIERPGTVPHRLNVRLADVEQPLPPKEEQQPVLVHAIDKASPVPAPEPKPMPAPPQPPSPATGPQQAKPSDAKPGMPEPAAGATTLDMPLPEDTTYYPAREVDEHPVLASGGRPVYPEKAAQDNIKGEVTVLILLNENGAADEVEIIEAKPVGAGFEEAVTAWLHNARFKPAMRKGRAVKARVVYHVSFEP